MFTNILETSKLTRKTKCAVIGDVMLDRYLLGTAERISPEAPVPVVDVSERRDNLGGAGNVMSNTVALGSKTWCFGVIGQDVEGDCIKRMLSKKGINSRYLLTDKSRNTTTKCRIVVGHNQLIRYDFETCDNISREIEAKFVEGLERVISEIDCLIISDYDKGVMSPSLANAIRRLSKKNHVKTIVDPKVKNARSYIGFDYVKLNINHADKLTGMSYSPTQDIRKVVYTIADILQTENVVVTLGKDGLIVLCNSNITHIPTHAREVYDVTGAGDVVTAVLAITLAQGYDLISACKFATLGAAIKVSKAGTYSVSTREIADSVASYRDSNGKS